MINFANNKTLKLEKATRYIFNISIIILLAIFPMSHTIALRNSVLLLAVAISILIIYLNKNKLNIYKKYTSKVHILLIMIPIYCLFFNIYFIQDAKKIDGTWLRMLLFIILGITFVLINKNSINKLFIILIGTCIPIVVNLIIWLMNCFILDSYLIEYNGIFKGKNAVSYFSIILILFSLITYISGLQLINKLNLKNHFLIILFISFIIGYLSIFNANSLFGVIFTSLILLMSIFYFKNSYKTLITICITLIISFNYFGGSKDARLVNLPQDFIIAFKSVYILNDGNKNLVSIPTRSDGNQINASLYERMNWMSYGFDYLISAENLLKRSLKYPTFRHDSLVTSDGTNLKNITHSGLIDFGLGLGIVPLLLFFASYIFLGYQSFRAFKMGVESYPLYIILCLLLIWFFSEIFDREYVEHSLFTISFLSSALSASIYSREKKLNDKVS